MGASGHGTHGSRREGATGRPCAAGQFPVRACRHQPPYPPRLGPGGEQATEIKFFFNVDSKPFARRLAKKAYGGRKLMVRDEAVIDLTASCDIAQLSFVPHVKSHHR
jgi:hypothetical protein